MRSPKTWRPEYDLRGYGAMIADAVRMKAYHAALRRCIKPGAVVVDLGAGTGIMSLLACKLGAARVHAIEPSDVIAVGRELARANGCADRIEFHHGSSFDVTLARKADVLVSDLRGVLPLHGQHIASIADARARLLAPGGAQIPQRDTIRVQPVSDPKLYAESLRIWRDGALGLDLSPALHWAAHQTRKVDLARSRLVGTPRTLVELDYTTLEAPDVDATVDWRIAAPVTVHGIGAWFDTTLTAGVRFSNAPDKPRAIYGQLFLPLLEPLAAKRGERLELRVAATLVGSNYVWQWDTTLRDARGGVRAALRQSTFQAAPVNPAALGRRAAGYVPRSGPQARAAARALALIEQGRTVEQIAAQVAAEFAGALSAREARELVADLCDWLGG